MKVPIIVENLCNNGKEQFIVWHNNKKEIIDAPIKPYFYSLEKLDIPCAKVTKVKARRLSDYKECWFYKYEFNTREELVKHRIKGKTFEDNIPFILRNRIDNPNLFSEFPHKNEPKLLFLDIEQYCPPNKLFPSYDDRIIAISFAENDRKVKTLYLKSETKSDKELLEAFAKIFPKPDILVLYNKFYDLPTIFERCKRLGINPNFLSKTNKQPHHSNRYGLHMDGILVYDVLDSVKKDQSLTGNVPDRGLKTVSTFFGYKSDIKIDMKKISTLVGTKELVEYNRDDVKRLMFLFDIYWETIINLAEDLKIPLSEAVDLSITDLGIIVLGDLYKEHNIIADGDNYTRYPEIFQRKKKPGESNYQGALVFIKRTGLFKPVYKADYSSMYPSIIANFNFSPDTLTLVGYEPYKENGFTIKETDHSFIYYIPDNVLKKTVVIEVAKKPGFLSKAVKHFLDERAKYKKEYKQTGSKIALARSNIAKVKANGGIYGIMGAPHHPFGHAPIAIATTGIGRECVKLLVNILEDLYPNSVIEVDTDGVYFTANECDIQTIIRKFNETLRAYFKKDLQLSIDIDSYDAGYFHRAKNYILKKGDSIIFHGVAMKASNKDGISKKLIYDLAEALLSNKPTKPIIEKYLNNIKDFELEDFAMQVTLSKRLSEYKNKNSIPVRIATKAYQAFGIKPTPGNVYHYVKTKYGYELLQLAKKEDIDYNYYINKLKRIIKEIFDLEINSLNNLSNFVNDSYSSTLETKPQTISTKHYNIEDFI